MARVTVENCVDKIPNRFELVLIAAHRARALATGSAITVEPENDKNPVVALREIAEKTVSPGDMRERLIHSIQKQVEVDEPDAVAALAENCPEGPHLPPRRERVAEIKDLNDRLDAIGTLENLRIAVRGIERYDFDVKEPTHYRIEFDNVKREVRVKAHRQPLTAIHENDATEQESVVSGNNQITTVFVEADRVEDLMDGYPNYFGDVQVFTTNMQAIISDKPAKEYVMPPQETVPMPPREAPDLSWFRRHKRWN